MLCDTNLNSTLIYIHLAQNFNKLEDIKICLNILFKIYNTYGDEYINNNLSKEQWKIFNAIRNCRTKTLATIFALVGKVLAVLLILLNTILTDCVLINYIYTFRKFTIFSWNKGKSIQY